MNSVLEPHTQLRSGLRDVLPPATERPFPRPEEISLLYIQPAQDWKDAQKQVEGNIPTNVVLDLCTVDNPDKRQVSVQLLGVEVLSNNTVSFSVAWDDGRIVAWNKIGFGTNARGRKPLAVQ
jgi:hypothetical protein